MPQGAGGATAITPKNGFSGSSRPQGSRPVIRSPVERDVDQVASPGNRPAARLSSGAE